MLVSDSILKKVIDAALSQGADFAEVYLEDTRRKQFSYLDSKPEKAISVTRSAPAFACFQARSKSTRTQMIYPKLV